MKIICIENGLKIKYNNDEENLETVFGLDDDDNLIQTFTYPTNITIDSDCNLSIYPKVDIESGYLLYSFRYQISFGHFMTQTIPKLTEYMNHYKHLKLLIPKHHYDLITQNILETLNLIPNVYLLNEKTLYNIKTFQVSQRYEAPPGNLHCDHLWIYNQIRNNLIIDNELGFSKYIYLKRDNVSSDIGIYRQILNENDLIENLEKIGFETITLGNKSIYDKNKLLNNTKILITPIGANVMNLLFSNLPHNIIFLSNDLCYIYDNYIINLIQTLNKKNNNSIIFKYKSNIEKVDPLNSMNAPYFVDIQQIINYIKNI